MRASRIQKQLRRTAININTTEVNMKAEARVIEQTGIQRKQKVPSNQMTDIALTIAQAWKAISPWWPLKNLIAANPLRGFEDLRFEQALHEGMRHFQNTDLQKYIEDANRETIKWCQVFFDEGQGIINMPGRSNGIYLAWRKLALHDDRLHRKHADKINWLKQLPQDPEQVIRECLNKLNIPYNKWTVFLTILLTSLPGWASYIKYKTEWTQGYLKHSHHLTQAEYLAIRIIITCLLLPDPYEMIAAFEEYNPSEINNILQNIYADEAEYQQNLTHQLSKHISSSGTREKTDAQFVFCIDVRSEPLRRAIEAQGSYETFGYAGFFGIPVIMEDQRSGEEYATCPVLLTPRHKVKCRPTPFTSDINYKQRAKTTWLPKRLYKNLKYHFVTPFALAEAIGAWSGIWMTARTLFSGLSKHINSLLNNTLNSEPFIDARIPMQDQYAYAENALRTIGLTSNFAPIVVLCGHGSSTENNAYATALDCGACGGHDGAANAKLLANILNNPLVRDYLKKQGIFICDETIFIAGLHNTTTDEVTLYNRSINNELINRLRDDLKKARYVNCEARYQELSSTDHHDKIKCIKQRSADWSETRPEWGLARNAAFIVGPRRISEKINLDGRAFLHSYSWQEDEDGSTLTTVLTAPMVVAQWINSQYLFSTLDNVAYGSGSKITHNITGKVGVMQGNASDLMHGLPLQSIASSDKQKYHQPMRLLVCIHAPKDKISKIIDDQEILQKLFGNGWVNVICLDPLDNRPYQLQHDFSWCATNSEAQT